MRDYNFRRDMKEKEQERREFLVYETGYWPCTPKPAEDESGKKYFTEGAKSVSRSFHKRAANKAIRRAELDSIGSDSNYRKAYDLWWEWFQPPCAPSSTDRALAYEAKG